MKVVGHFINGETCTPKGRMQDVYNPATGEAEKLVLLACDGKRRYRQRAKCAAEWRNTPVSKRLLFPPKLSKNMPMKLLH